jgi:hydroxyacyl-ACP dehydratase HTD2-like protein with hotdog domain
VVHGPLTLSLLLEAIRGTVAKRWKTMAYRVINPTYVGDAVKLNAGVVQDGKVESWAEKGDMVPVMKVALEFW